MPAEKIRNEFVIRLVIATALMAASLWYLGSLWDARMREQNLILIEPVVLIMIPFYLATIWFEYRRYRKELENAVPVSLTGERAKKDANRQDNANRNQIIFMVVAALSVPGFYILGAIPATILLILAGLLVLGERRPLVIAITTAVTTFVLWLVFVELFGIRMPLFPWS
jgi:hypothetical protein